MYIFVAFIFAVHFAFIYGHQYQYIINLIQVLTNYEEGKHINIHNDRLCPIFKTCP